MRRFKLNRTSLVRILPALFVGIIPFTLFDQALLRVHYSLRGPLAPKSDIAILSAADAGQAREAVKLATSQDFESCHLITDHPNHFRGVRCSIIDISGRYTEESIRAAVTATFPKAFLRALESPAMPMDSTLLFYGKIAQLKSGITEMIIARPEAALSDVRKLLVIDESIDPRLPLPSPVGTLDQAELAANVALNLLEAHSALIFPFWFQWVIAIAMTLAAAVMLYSYPILISLVFTLVLGGAEFVASYLVFESYGATLPLAASWASMLTVVLLGMGDRLDRRERREWDVEREAENLRSLDEMRNNFLSLVSHDLKTPVAKILTVLERFLRGDFGIVSPEQREALGRLVSTSGYLQRTISTILLLSRIESHDFRIQRAPTDLNELIDSAVRTHQGAAAERRITIQAEVEPLFLVDMDRDLILQVLNNLLDNALKYSPPGSRVSVRNGESENCVELSPPQPGLWFEIQDAGPGIPESDRKKVLEKFVRGSNESTASDQSVKGTGLGLYLCRFFVDRHAGSLALFSKTPGEKLEPGNPAFPYFDESDSGTVVRVTLPIDAPPLLEG